VVVGILEMPPQVIDPRVSSSTGQGRTGIDLGLAVDGAMPFQVGRIVGAERTVRHGTWIGSGLGRHSVVFQIMEPAIISKTNIPRSASRPLPDLFLPVAPKRRGAKHAGERVSVPPGGPSPVRRGSVQRLQLRLGERLGLGVGGVDDVVQIRHGQVGIVAVSRVEHAVVPHGYVHRKRPLLLQRPGLGLSGRGTRLRSVGSKY
jgi:hypothetical protein